MIQSSSSSSSKMKINIMICGNISVGKTSIIKYYLEQHFTNNQLTTVQMQILQNREIVNGEQVVAVFNDLPGCHRAVDLTKQSIRQADGFIFVYDILDAESLKEIDLWVAQISQIKQDWTNCKCILIANKIDARNYISTCISSQKGKEKADNYKWQFYEVSAKEGLNIKPPIKNLIKDIYCEKKGILRQSEIESFNQNIQSANMILIHPNKSQSKTKRICNRLRKFFGC